MTIGSNTNNVIEGSVVPDGGWGWVIVFSSLMIHFIMDGITYSMGDVFLRPMMENLNTTRGPVSVIFGLLPAITLATGPIATIFTNTYGCRKVTIVGSCLAGVGFLLSYFFANIYFYYISIGIIGGVGFGLIYLPAIVSVGFYFERKRSFAMGIAVCGSGLGTLVFPAIMPYIINQPFWLDYHGALLIESAIIFICVVFGALMVPLPQEPSEIRRAEKKSRLKEKLREKNQQKEEEQNEKSNEGKNIIESIKEDEETNKKGEEEESSTVIIRKDAIYQGSLHNIPLYNENTNEYHKQIIGTEIIKKKVRKNFMKKIAEQIDLKLLKDASFFLFAISNFLTSLGFNVPYNFANDLAADSQVMEHRRHWIIMTIGISNCFGRVIIGYLADRSWVNRLTLYNTTLIIAGLSTMFAPFCNHLVQTHMIYAGFFGFFSGGYVGLTSIIIVDLVGVDKLSDAFGVLLLFQGIAVAIGTPIVGTMRDAFSNFSRPYLGPYLIFGGSILLSGLILFAIPLLQKRKENHEKLTKHQLEMGVLSYSKQNLSQLEQQQEQQPLNI